MAKCAVCGFEAPIWEWKMQERWEGLFHFTDYVCPKCGAKNKMAFMDNANILWIRYSSRHEQMAPAKEG